MMDLTGILLAAGSARRFGAPKLLHRLDDGTPIGVAAARNLLAALPDSVAVVRPGDRELIDALSATGLGIIEHPQAELGLGSSLAAGVNASADALGWLIALADMPWIRPTTIDRLAADLRAGSPIVAPAYHGRRGHPVGFAAQWRAQLRRLRGDTGARSLIAANRTRLSIRDTDDAGVLADIDHPRDLERPDL